MRIPCPYCGERGRESSPISAMPTSQRPDPDAPPTRSARLHDYVYLRDNPAGPHHELWYHARRLPHLARRDARHAHPRDPSASSSQRDIARTRRDRAEGERHR